MGLLIGLFIPAAKQHCPSASKAMAVMAKMGVCVFGVLTLGVGTSFEYPSHQGIVMPLQLLSSVPDRLALSFAVCFRINAG